jgi:hypothetical protein
VHFISAFRPILRHAADRVDENIPSATRIGEILVFLVRNDTKCAECGKELFRGSMITLTRDKGALCLGCADLDHLEYLPSGDAALTRRTSKNSRLKAVVLQWSRSRKRYERQGILAETEAIQQAETECLADADQRQRQAVRRAEREAELDRDFVRAFSMADSIAGLRPDGRLVLMGLEDKPLPVHPGDLIARRLRILGSQQNDREYLYEALQIAASGKVKVMTEIYPLDEVTKAYDRVADGKVRFRAVITTGA